MKQQITINDTTVTFRSLTIREAYDIDSLPELTPDLLPLFLAFESDFAFVVLSADCPPALLLDGDEQEIMEAFRKANPFVEKPRFKELRAMKTSIIERIFSGLSANLSSADTLTSGDTP